jgi:prepilin-type N-terminal cleavage/methylation domain-containing protein
MRRGLSLFEVVLALAILAVLAVGVLTWQANASADAGLDNIEQTARVLSEFSEAIGLYTNTKASKVTSFFQVIGAAPRALSQLTSPISASDRNSCGASVPQTNASTYTSAQVGAWAGQFFRHPLPTTGYLIAPGFFADDTLKRYSATFNAGGPPYFQEQYFDNGDKTTPGTIAIVIRNVKIEDARALAQRSEGDRTGVRGAVRFDNTALDGSLVTVEYHINIHGC